MLFTIKNQFFFKEIANKQTSLGSNTEFPLVKNPIDMFAFSCEIKELVYDDYILANDIVVKLSAKCMYLDKLEKKQEITVPIVLFNPKNNYHLVGRKQYEGDLSQWQDIDFIHSIEETYYYEHGTNVSVYEKPEPLKYWRDTTNKPTLDPGDKLLLDIANKESSIYLTKNDFNADYFESVLFNKDYHEYVYTYEDLNNFVMTGNPNDMNLENNLLIPNFVQYIKDVNPS